MCLTCWVEQQGFPAEFSMALFFITMENINTVDKAVVKQNISLRNPGVQQDKYMNGTLKSNKCFAIFGHIWPNLYVGMLWGIL